MALITITGTFHDPNGTIPSSGTITFKLDGYFVAEDGHIITHKQETATLDVNGAFSITLESTLNGTPSSRKYKVDLTGVVEGINISVDLGNIQIASTPTSQALKDLINTALTEDKVGQWVHKETPTGTVDGSNKIFTLSRNPLASSEYVYLNDLFTSDYTISGAQITFVVAPQTGDKVRVTYQFS